MKISYFHLQRLILGLVFSHLFSPLSLLKLSLALCSLLRLAFSLLLLLLNVLSLVHHLMIGLLVML